MKYEIFEKTDAICKLCLTAESKAELLILEIANKMPETVTPTFKFHYHRALQLLEADVDDLEVIVEEYSVASVTILYKLNQ